jgi:invasion protein IalB
MSAYAKQVLSKSVVMALAAGSLLTAAVEGRAQQSQQQQGQQQQASPWVKLCGKFVVAPEGENAREANVCRTFQERLNNKDAQIAVAVAVNQREGEEGVRLAATVPLGVDLRTAPQIRIDSGKPVKLAYVICDAIAGCTADAMEPVDIVKAMKTGQKLVIEVRGLFVGPLSFDLPLTGFAAAYDGKPGDAQQYQAMREGTVNAIRARRAEQVQKALERMDSQQQSQQQQSQEPPTPQSQQAPLQVEPQP